MATGKRTNAALVLEAIRSLRLERGFTCKEIERCIEAGHGRKPRGVALALKRGAEWGLFEARRGGRYALGRPGRADEGGEDAASVADCGCGRRRGVGKRRKSRRHSRRRSLAKRCKSRRRSHSRRKGVGKRRKNRRRSRSLRRRSHCKRRASRRRRSVGRKRRAGRRCAKKRRVVARKKRCVKKTRRSRRRAKCRC